MSVPQIKMRVVLAEINQDIRDDQAHVFAISYIKADGSYGHKARVRKSGSNPLQGKKQGEGKFGYKVKEKGVLMLHCVDSDKPFCLKISRVTHFNNIRIWH